MNSADKLANGKSATQSLKAAFRELKPQLDRKSFIERLVLDSKLTGPDAYEYGKHLENVWRGKAAPTLAEYETTKQLAA